MHQADGVDRIPAQEQAASPRTAPSAALQFSGHHALIADDIIHKSDQVRRWLTANPTFEPLFQPVDHPWINQTERLWRSLHETVGRKRL
jgi:hypothetical protein